MVDPRSLSKMEALVTSIPMGRRAGELTRVVGLALECRGLVSALGEVCRIERGDLTSLDAEVVGFRETATLLMPLGDAEGLGPGARVLPLGRSLGMPCGDFLLGRVVDALGRPLDEAPLQKGGVTQRLQRPAPAPLERLAIDEPLATGIAVIDGFLTLGRGQRIGIFAGSGVGKSTLLAAMAKSSHADVNVIALIGERGREVRAFLEETLTPEARRRTVVVVATSDAPPFLRYKAAFTAISIAEYFRDHGKDVLLVADSITRLAGATREIGLALGEPPTVKGYPPSFFSAMPRLVERMGRTRTGSITGVLTVLVDGDDLSDPVADTLRGLLDGHIVLSRELAGRGHHPAVDVLESVSRVIDRITTPQHREAVTIVRRALSVLHDVRDLVAVGAYRPGSDAAVDRALAARGDIERFLCQASGACRPMEDTLAQMAKLADGLTSRGAVRGPVPTLAELRGNRS